MTMQILKKISAGILVIAIGLLFAGCNDETPAPPSPTPPPPNSSQPQQPQGQGWAPEEGQSEQSREPLYQQGQQDNSTESEWP
ncbi:hypothetical protein [Limihaloglobus sulfuriphilus]|uniref:hypothetical protein n=1 Tax=Limihaloglobus sulfuriphilus TaxID=1851148 RepID=UPI0011BA894C|nr:hypothetical protein [Limihaloglobus sulfuriphilus]